MRETVTRIERKVRSSGFISTLQSAWMELYLHMFLNSGRVQCFLNDYFDLPVINSSEHQIVSLDRAGSVTAELPDKTWIDGDRQPADAETQYVPEPSLYSYRDCYLFTPPGVGVTANGAVIRDTIASDIAWSRGRSRTYVPKLISEHGFRRIHRYLHTTPAIGSYDFSSVFPVLPYWRNYYHWTAECLPRLLWFDQNVFETEPKLLIPSDPAGWMIESLELLGFTDYVEVEKGIYTIEEMNVSTAPEPSPEGCEWLRETAFSNLDIDEEKQTRVYISRQNANRRRVRNKDEIMSVLSEYGFRSYLLEDLSVREQAKLFANADVVVGPHGAGFANLLYARDTAVIELFGPRKKLTYYRLSKLLGLEYTAVTGKSSLLDITVDPTALREVIEDIVD